MDKKIKRIWEIDFYVALPYCYGNDNHLSIISIVIQILLNGS